LFQPELRLKTEFAGADWRFKRFQCFHCSPWNRLGTPRMNVLAAYEIADDTKKAPTQNL
jgi:hypothetical protein